MHLALRSHLDGSWTPLNENYGIFFAAGVPIAAATPNPDVRAPRRHDSRPIRTRRCEPPATPSRTARRCPAWTSNSKASRIRTCSGWRPAGSPWRRPAPRAAAARKGSERSAFLLATTSDLTSYDQRGLVLLGPTSGVHVPRSYTTMQNVGTSSGGMTTTATRCARYAPTSSPRSAPRCRPNRTIPPNRLPQAMPTMSTQRPSVATTASRTPSPATKSTSPNRKPRRSSRRFGRVYNTGVTVPSMTVSADLYDGEARDLIGSLGRTTANLQYSDGSTAMRAVDWGRRTARRPRRRRRSWQAQAGRTPYGPRSHPPDRLSRAVRRRTRRSVRVRMELQR